MKKKILTAAIAAAAVMAGSSMSVSAAGLKDVFDAGYYADRYADLYEAFGYDGEALYNHFITYGLSEGRQMNLVFDVQAYRTAYADLEAAFGNDWDAYVDHYFAYGMAENRTEGVRLLSEPEEFTAAYPDAAAAFGNDYAAIIRYYVENVVKAGIIESAESSVKNNAENSADSGVAQTQGSNYARVETEVDEGYTYVTYYDENDKKVRYEITGPDYTNVWEFEYDAAGTLTALTNKCISSDGMIWTWCEVYADGTPKTYIEYDENGNVLEMVQYDEYGNGV